MFASVSDKRVDMIKSIYSFTIIIDITQCLEGLTIFTFIEKNFTAHSMTQHKKWLGVESIVNGKEIA